MNSLRPLFHLLVLTAIAAPFLNRSPQKDGGSVILSPAASRLIFERRLVEAPLTKAEDRFGEGFPGNIRRFTGSGIELVVRTVHSSTRLLHPSSDCFRGLGYMIHPLPSDQDENGLLWSCFKATDPQRELKVCEHISGLPGGEWSDVSSWYWSALFHPEKGPWSAMTKAERYR